MKYGITLLAWLATAVCSFPPFFPVVHDGPRWDAVTKDGKVNYVDTNIVHAFHLGLFPPPIPNFVPAVPSPAPPPIVFDWSAIESQYPWRPAHDKNRLDHWRWDRHQRDAWCLHVRPGSRKPKPTIRPHPSGYLPQNCTDFLHSQLATPAQLQGGMDIISCGDIIEEGENLGQAHAYLLGHRWEDAEHCRAGCETCFDAMAEFGAEQAICRRHSGDAACAAGLVFGRPPGLGCTKDNHLEGTSNNFMGIETDFLGVFANCTLNKNAPRYAELGYATLNDATNSGEAKLYYMHRLPEVGLEQGGEWGRHQALLAALEEGDRVNDLKRWLAANKNKY